MSGSNNFKSYREELKKRQELKISILPFFGEYY